MGGIILRPGDKVLVDLDETVYDWVGGINTLVKNHKILRPIDQNTRKAYWILDIMTKEQSAVFWQLISQKGFFLSLPLIQGAKEALENLVRYGLDVWICTKPYSDPPERTYCIDDKTAAIERDFGRAPDSTLWSDKIIFSDDKTKDDGVVLIDDNPDISGENPTPSWKQVLYAWPFNQNSPLPRLVWDTKSPISYRKILGLEK